MKDRRKIIILMIMALCSSQGVQGQSTVGDIVETSAISVYKAGGSAPITLRSNAAQLISYFGSPLSVVTEASEMYPEVPTTRYNYSGANFSFESNYVVNFELTSNSFSLKYNTTIISVGDDISTLSNVFPNSYGLREDDRMIVGLKQSGEDLDVSIVFLYDSSNVINKIIY